MPRRMDQGVGHKGGPPAHRMGVKKEGLSVKLILIRRSLLTALACALAAAAIFLAVSIPPIAAARSVPVPVENTQPPER